MQKNVLTKVAKEFGTPIYVYDESIIEKQCKLLVRALPRAAFHYACKANSNPRILAVIRKADIGIEAVSVGELKLAKAIGFQKQQISFTCSNLTEAELRHAAKLSGRVHLDSLHQIELWGKHKLGKHISLRLNQGVGAGHHEHVITGGPDSKFGIALPDIPRAKAIAKKYGLVISSLHQHIGSNILDEFIMLKAVQVLLKTAAQFSDVRHLDFGGGFGVPYQLADSFLDLKKFARKLNPLINTFERRGSKISYSFEPGRFLVAEAGMLLVQVVDTKRTGKHIFVGVNSGFNHLMRPVMYGAYHCIENISRSRGTHAKITIAGNICESGDIFAKNRVMLMPKLGDILAIQNTGAYGMSMASTYNMRALPREVLITRGDKSKEISFSKAKYL
ncbi:MAG: diaminopimelate decarboxylase [Patescibacteria group bacterium]